MHGGEKGVLLRRRVHMRAKLPMPAFMRVRGSTGEERLSTMDTTAMNTGPTNDAVLTVVFAAREQHLAYLRRKLFYQVDPEDALQLALMRASKHLDEVRDSTKASAWFWQILRNVVYDENERIHKENQLLKKLPQMSEIDDSITEQSLATCACSIGVMDQLKQEYSELLRRVDMNEESIEDLAREFGVTANNLTVRLFRARKSMRKALLDHCGTDSAKACMSCGCDEGKNDCR